MPVEKVDGKTVPWSGFDVETNQQQSIQCSCGTAVEVWISLKFEVWISLVCKSM